MNRIHTLVGPLCAALMAGAVAGAPIAASGSVDDTQQKTSATTDDAANRGPHCWGSVLWSSNGKLKERVWKVSPKNRWRAYDRNTSRKKLGIVPRAFVFGGAGGGSDVQISTEYLISKRRAVVRVDTKTYNKRDVIRFTKKRVGRLKGKARPMSGMLDLYLVGKGGRVTYAPDIAKPNKRVRVRGLRLRNYRFGSVAYVGTKKFGPVNVMYVVRGSKLVRVVLKGRKVVRAPRVVSRSGWRNAKGVAARVCIDSTRLSVVRIGNNRKARGFLQRRVMAKRPAKLGKGVKLAGRYPGRGFGS